MVAKLKSYFKLIRWFNVLFTGVAVFLFHQFVLRANFELVNAQVTLNYVDVLLLCLSVMLVMAAGNVLNDFFDFEQDKKFKQQKIVLGKLISLDEAIYTVAALNVLGIAIAAFLSWKVGQFKLVNVFLLAAILLWQYSATLKKLPLVGNLIVSLLCAFVFALPVLFEPKLLQAGFHPGLKKVVMVNLIGYSTFAFLATLIREIVKDAEDVEADSSTSYKTIPVVFGVGFTRVLSVVLVTALCACIGFVMYLYWIGDAKNHFWYAALFLQFPLLVNILPLAVANKKVDFAVMSAIMKVVMVFGVATLPLFHLFSR